MTTALVVIAALCLGGVAGGWWKAKKARRTAEGIRRMYGLPGIQEPPAHFNCRCAPPDPDAGARVDALQRKLGRSGLTLCKRFGHALIDGRCQRPDCTYTTQRSER